MTPASPRRSPPADAVVAAAGSGVRYAAGGEAPAPKQFLPLAGRPLLVHAAEAMLAAPGVRRVAVVLPKTGFSAWRARVEPFLAAADDRVRFCAGGATRQESVRRGLDALGVGGPAARNAAEGAATGEEAGELIAVHDGARPAAAADLVAEVFRAAARHGAAAPVVTPTDTLFRVASGNGAEGRRLAEVIPREDAGAAQTPQCFRREVLAEALAAAERSGFAGTDEASLARFAGHPVAAVAGDSRNSKVTTPADLEALRGRFRPSRPGGPPPRLGFGFDAHRFGETGTLRLGGVAFPGTPALLGHSDGDALLHALADAVLGAVGAPDIGALFPSTDERLRGAASGRFVARAVEVAAAAGHAPGQADLTLIGERPRLGPKRDEVRASVARLLGIPPSSVGLKATTTDGMGWTGRGEGLAAQALVRLDAAAPAGAPSGDSGPG